MFTGITDEGKALPKASEVFVDSWIEDWGSNPHIGCGYSSPSTNAGPRENGLTARQIIAQPHGKIVFCGEATVDFVDVTV